MIEQIVEAIRNATDAYAKLLPPNGDWQPTMFLFKDGQMKTSFFNMPPSGPMREFLFESVMPNQIKKEEPDAIVILVSAWAAEYEPEDGVDLGDTQIDTRPSERPDRKEVVMIQGVAKDGEECGVAGEIIRSEGHPELDWELFPDTDSFGGQMMAALRRGVWE